MHCSKIHLRILISLLGRQLEPFRRLLFVRGHPLPVQIGHAKVVLGARHPLVGSLAIPANRFPIVSGNAAAGGIGYAQIELRPRQFLVGRLAQPRYRLFTVASDTLAEAVDDAELVLGRGMPSFGQRQQEFQCLGVILARVGGRRFVETGAARQRGKRKTGKKQNSEHGLLVVFRAPCVNWKTLSNRNAGPRCRESSR